MNSKTFFFKSLILALIFFTTSSLSALHKSYIKELEDSTFSRQYNSVDDFRAWYDREVAETIILPGGLFSTWNSYSLKQIGFYTREKSLQCYLFDNEAPFKAFIKDSLVQMDTKYLKKLPPSLRKKPIEVYGNVVCIISAPLKIKASDAELELGRLLVTDNIKELSRRFQSGLSPETACAYNHPFQGIIPCTLLELALRMNKDSKKVPFSPMMELILSEGYDINRPFKGVKNTPLTWAITDRNLKMVKMFVERGADVNQPDGTSSTPLAFAVINDQYQIASYLLEKGADPNKKNKSGDVPIFQARGDMLTLLLKHGARLDFINSRGQTLMDRALVSGDKELMRLLLDNGARITKKAAEKQHALHSFALAGDLDRVKYCVETLHMDVNEFLNIGNTLYWANSRKNNSEVIEYLIKKGAQVNYSQNVEKTILTMAAWNGRLSKAVVLIKHGAVINDRKDEIPECLRWALENKNRLAMMKLLIENGAHYKDKTTSIMHLASYYKDLTAFKYTVKLMGNNINMQDSRGDTPLIRAASMNNLSVMRYLMKAGADPHIKNKEGGTAFDFAPADTEAGKILRSKK